MLKCPHCGKKIKPAAAGEERPSVIAEMTVYKVVPKGDHHFGFAVTDDGKDFYVPAALFDRHGWLGEGIKFLGKAAEKRYEDDGKAPPVLTILEGPIID